MQRIVHEDGLIRVAVDQSELVQNNLDEAKIEMLLHIMTNIQHDGIFLLFKHYPNANQPYLKCSFRTKNPDLDVSKIAGHFGGWGHRAAAACRITSKNLDETQQAIINLSKTYS